MADFRDKKASVFVASSEAARTATNGTNGDKLDGRADNDLPLMVSLKKWKRTVLYCFALTPAILMYGYDYAVVGTSSAMPSFQRDYGILLDDKWILPALWLSLWNFISAGCAMPGALLGGLVHDHWGRRASLALGSVLSAVAVAVCFVSYVPPDINVRRGVFLAGKGLQGASIGMVTASTQAYMSEILPSSLRGPVLAFFPIFTLLGQLAGAVVVFACLKVERGYAVCFATQWLFSALSLAAVFVLPESPTYLVRKGRLADAVAAQRCLYQGGQEDAEQTVKILRRDIERERSSTARATYVESFRGANRRRSLIVIFAGQLPQLFGLTLLSKASYFLQIVGMAPTPSIIMLILGVVLGLAANVTSMWVLSRVGRRRMILWSLAGLVVVWMTTGIAGCFQTDGAVWYTAVSLMLVVIVAGVGVWPASYVVSSETSSLHLRGRAQGLAWFSVGGSVALFAFVLPFIYNPDQGDLGGKTGFIFAVLSAVSWVLSFLCVPEMKGRTAAEIDKMFEMRLPTRAFRDWSGGDRVAREDSA